MKMHYSENTLYHTIENDEQSSLFMINYSHVAEFLIVNNEALCVPDVSSKTYRIYSRIGHNFFLKHIFV